MRSVIEVARLRHAIFKCVRAYFDSLGFLEIDAPILISANAVETHVEPIAVATMDGKKRYLMTSPEICLKRMLAHGADRIFSVAHVFRNEDTSQKHLQEFPLLEWYRINTNLASLIADVEGLLAALQKELAGITPLNPIEFGTFETLEMATAWEMYAQIDLLECLFRMSQGNENALTQAVLQKGHYLRPNPNFEDAFSHIMAKCIEPSIGQNSPCVLTKWPSVMSALAEVCTDQPLLCNRFEIYWKGLELANAFQELRDPIEQRARFMIAQQERLDLDKPLLPMPERFLSDLAKMPVSSGIALGIDRMIMALLDLKEITEIAYFRDQ